MQSDKVWIKGDTTLRYFDTLNVISDEPVRIGKPFEIIRRMKWIEANGLLKNIQRLFTSMGPAQHRTKIPKCDSVVGSKGKSRIGFSTGCVELTAKLMHLRQQYMRCGVRWI